MTISLKAEMGFPAQFHLSVTREQAHQNSNLQDLYACIFETDRRDERSNAILPTRSVFGVPGATQNSPRRTLGRLGPVEWFNQQSAHL